MDDRNPYPPPSRPSEPTEPLAEPTARPEDPHTAAVSAIGADMTTRLAALDQLYAADKITASELGAARRSILTESVPAVPDAATVTPELPASTSTAAGPAITAAGPAVGGAGGAGAPPTQVRHDHIGPPEPPKPKRIAGLPVWGAAAIGAAVVAALVIGAVFLFGGGSDDSDTTADTEGVAYVAKVQAPLGQLTSSVVAVGKGLARADAPADLKGLNRLAERQIDVVESARRTLSGVKVTSADRASQQRLIKAAADQRRFLVALGRATASTPTEASLKALNRARSAAGQTIASYRAFFAVTPGATDAITATDITDTSGVRAAIQKAIADAAPPTGGGTTTKPGPTTPTGPYSGGSFQSPTGNLRCQISGSTLFCSSSNDGFGVSLPAYGPSTTGSGQASGGVTVPYGSTWSSGLFSCSSDFDGITCSNQSGNGFFLNRDTYRPF